MQIFDLFDVKQRGVIDFGDFVRALNVFHPSISQEDKIDCKLLAFSSFREIFSTLPRNVAEILHNFAVSFKLYDLDGTGYIERKAVILFCYLMANMLINLF